MYEKNKKPNKDKFELNNGEKDLKIKVNINRVKKEEKHDFKMPLMFWDKEIIIFNLYRLLYLIIKIEMILTNKKVNNVPTIEDRVPSIKLLIPLSHKIKRNPKPKLEISNSKRINFLVPYLFLKYLIIF